MKTVSLREGTVKRLLGRDGSEWQHEQPVGGVEYVSKGVTREARSQVTLVCDGMYSKFRTQLAEHDVQSPSHFVGLILDRYGERWNQEPGVHMGSVFTHTLAEINCAGSHCTRVDMPAWC